MTNLYQFLKDEKSGQSLQISVEEGSSLVASAEKAVVLSLQDSDVPDDQAAKFAKGLAKIVSSDAFLKELSAEIREPGLTESEDAFVERAKLTMRKLLDRHLG